MGRCASAAAIAIAAALIACGSTTSTSAEAPRTRDTADISERPPDEPAASRDASPPAPPSVTFAALVEAMESANPDDVIAGLGDLGLTVQCPRSGWKPVGSGVVETASCPGGALRLGDVGGTLEVEVTRRIDDPSVATAKIVVTATGEREEWARRVRAMLLAARNAFDEISADEPLPYLVPVGGPVTAHVRDETGEPLRLVLAPRPSRGLLR